MVVSGLFGVFLSTALAATAGDEDVGRELFVKLCAQCHGVDGNGQGTVELDRPARSFRDGGFSFGNTSDAIVRTITNGIPGTPMPGFDALVLEERRALADHVRALGPQDDSEPPQTIALVGDETRMLRGHLGPIVEGGPESPRGLLVGIPSGLTFSFDVDGLRLRGVHVGGFADRVDWTGRGGTSLEPLGRVLHSVGGGGVSTLVKRVVDGVDLSPGTSADAPESLDELDVVPLRASLQTASLISPTFTLAAALHDGDELVGWTEQSAGALVSPSWSGYYRDLILMHQPTSDLPVLLVRVDDAPPGTRRTPVDLAGVAWRAIPEHPTAMKWLSGPLVAWRTEPDGPVHAVDITTRDPWRMVELPDGLHVALTHGRVGQAVVWPLVDGPGGER